MTTNEQNDSSTPISLNTETTPPSPLARAGETPLFGLVLAGGHSTRMGRDKAAIQWHAREQRYYMADILAQCCDSVFISCRAGQQDEIAAPYVALPDTYEGGGPLMGILSAFRAHPHVAWLVVACDLPLLDLATLRLLIGSRDASGMATAFRGPEDGLPEPLIAIWEPAAYGLLQQHIVNGFKCPRKALIRNEGIVRMIDAPDPWRLLNANTPADAEKVMEILEKEGRKTP